MTTSNYQQEYRVVNNLKNSGILFIIAGSVSFGLSIAQRYMATFWFIDTIRSVLFIAAVIFLITSIRRLGLFIPQYSKEVETARNWLVGWMVFSFIWPFGLLLLVIPGIIMLLLVPIARILGFLNLNTVFRRIGESYPQYGKLGSWVFPLYGFYGVISVIPTLIVTLITNDFLSVSLATTNIVLIVISVMDFLVILGVGYVLIQNSQKIEGISQAGAPGMPDAPQIQYEPIKEPTQTTVSEQPAKLFCENCGAKAEPNIKYCQHCGQSLG